MFHSFYYHLNLTTFQFQVLKNICRVKIKKVKQPRDESCLLFLPKITDKEWCVLLWYYIKVFLFVPQDSSFALHFWNILLSEQTHMWCPSSQNSWSISNSHFRLFHKLFVLFIILVHLGFIPFLYMTFYIYSDWLKWFYFCSANLI